MMPQSIDQLYKQLEAVQKAISKAETIQEYSVSSRSGKHADLNTLYKREEQLLFKIKRAESGGIVVRGITPCI